jgi:hypothetical protein
MISTVEEFERGLDALDPERDDFVLQADELVAGLAPEIAPSVYEPILRFFESHPKAACGAPGTLVHHLEDYYPKYVVSLRESVHRAPSYNGVLMINRILNSSVSREERTEYLGILRSVVSNGTAPGEVRNMAKRFLDRQAQINSEQGASPNGGPATRSGGSGVAEGPPSVS